MTDIPDGKNAADFIVQSIEGRPKIKVTTVYKCTSLRIPVMNLSKIDALAALANLNRTKIILHLLEVGMEEVGKKIVNPDLKIRFSELQGRKLKRLLTACAGPAYKDIFLKRG